MLLCMDQPDPCILDNSVIEKKRGGGGRIGRGRFQRRKRNDTKDGQHDRLRGGTKREESQNESIKRFGLGLGLGE